MALNEKKIIKHLLSEKNPVAIHRRNKMRRALINTSPTFLCPNCIGGILFHDLGIQFRSPTVNTMIYQPDFVKFVLNLDYYLAQELVFFNKPGYVCPCAQLGDITIHFTHYATPEEATAKWNERKTRIDKDNLFVFLTERDGLTKAEIQKVGGVRARGLVVFTAKDYPDIPYTIQIPKYRECNMVGNILKKRMIDDRKEYEQYFDFVEWFNSPEGSPYTPTTVHNSKKADRVVR